MRALLVLTLLAFLLPLASADSHVRAPDGSYVATANPAYGDGCSGLDGGQTHSVTAHAFDPRGANGYEEASVQSSCYRYEDGLGNVYSGSGLYVYAASYQFNGGGPGVYYAWYGGDSAGMKYCGSGVGSGTTGLALGCPSPDGSPPPVFPELP